MKLYDLSVSTGKYRDQAGKEKNRWKNIGSVMQNNEGGKYLLIDRVFNPAGLPVSLDNNGQPRDSIAVSMFEPKDQQQATQQTPSQITQPTKSFVDDEIPNF